MATRTRMKTKSGSSVYAVRGKDGKFKDIQNINRSIRADAAKKSKTKPKGKGKGNQGDY